jgi:fumarate reductase flavoprotein subunit
MRDHSFSSKLFAVVVLLAGCFVLPGFAAAPSFTHETDVVVVGAGGAGLSAAQTALEGGAKVILLEQNPFPGGTSNVAEGIFGAETKMQRDHYFSVPMQTKDTLFKHEMEFNHWKANAALVRWFVNQSAGTIDWLASEGVPFEEVSQTTFDGVRTWHVIKGHGATLVKVLFGKVKQNPNATVMMETGAVDLITDGQNNVIGVVAKNKDGEIRIKARAVILATGGFADNLEMVKQYAGNSFSGPVANFHKVGFGIKMAQKLGAQVEGMDVLMNSAVYDKKRSAVPGPANPTDLQFDAVSQQPMNIMVNVDGERFCDETIANNFILQSNAIARQPGNYAWVIFDNNLRRHYADDGIDGGMGVIVPAGSKVEKFDKALDQYAQEGDRNVFSADTPEELAAKIHVPAESLKKTIAEYNHAAAINLDEAFDKDRHFIKPITGKLYAIREVINYLVTGGGVKTNLQMQPLTKDRKPIQGLYVTGQDVGGINADTYGLSSPGTSFGFAVGSGRAAAQSILASLK